MPSRPPTEPPRRSKYLCDSRVTLTAVIRRTKAIPSYEKGNGKVEKTPTISNKLLRGYPEKHGTATHASIS